MILEEDFVVYFTALTTSFVARAEGFYTPPKKYISQISLRYSGLATGVMP